MRNFILAFLSTLLVIVATPPTHKTVVHEEAPYIKKYSVVTPLSQPVYAEKQELAKVPSAPQKTATASVKGDCASWLAQAGISDPDAVWLIGKESGCNPRAQNPTSTAYGIFQFLDGTWKGVGCVKTSDPLEQMRCGTKYVMNRYGSWSAARQHHVREGWY